MRQNAAALPAKARAVKIIAGDIFIVHATPSTCCKHDYPERRSVRQPVLIDDGDTDRHQAVDAEVCVVNRGGSRR